MKSFEIKNIDTNISVFMANRKLFRYDKRLF